MEQAFLLGMIKLLSEEKLLDDLSEALTEYKIVKNEETKRKVLVALTLATVKMTPVGGGKADDPIEEAFALMRTIQKHKKWDDLNPENNKEKLDIKN